MTFEPIFLALFLAGVISGFLFCKIAFKIKKTDFHFSQLEFNNITYDNKQLNKHLYALKAKYRDLAEERNKIYSELVQLRGEHALLFEKHQELVDDIPARDPITGRFIKR